MYQRKPLACWGANPVWRTTDEKNDNRSFDDVSADTRALTGSDQQNRRTFLRNASAAGLLGGFALAAQPIQAQQAIRTGFEGIEADEVYIEENGLDLYAYVATPKDKAGKKPIVIVCSEIFGVHEHIADVTRRFAKAGYMAIAPEFFTRAGDPTALGTIAEILKEIVGQTPDEQVMNDIGACLTWAGKNGGDIERVGVTGFLLGWPNHLAGKRQRATSQSGRGLVWSSGWRQKRELSRPSGRLGKRATSARARALWWG